MAESGKTVPGRVDHHDMAGQSWAGRIFPNSITRVVPGLSSGRCQPIRDETPSVTSLLAQQHGASHPMRYEFANFGTEF